MGQETGVEVGQEGRRQRGGPRRMDQALGKARPGIDLNEQLREPDAGQALSDALG